MPATSEIRPFKVALIQTRPKALQPELNFAPASEQISLAAAQGASLAVLPEYHLTGWVPDDASFALEAEDARRYLERYQELAARLHINICAGTIPTLLNTSYFIDHDGHILGAYTKTNLWIPERNHLTSSVEYLAAAQQKPVRVPEDAEEEEEEKRKCAPDGTSNNNNNNINIDIDINIDINPHQVFDTPLGPVGILVCWDLAFPEAFRHLVLAGAKIIIIPSYWTLADMSAEGLAYNATCERLFVQSALTARAFENTAAVIYCNVAGSPDEDRRGGFFGCSQVSLPIVGTVPGSFVDGEEGMRVVDVDMRVVEIAERNYNIRQDLGRADWHYGYVKSKLS